MKLPAVCWAWSRSNPVFSLNFRAAGAPEGQAVRRTASAAKPPASAEPKRPAGVSGSHRGLSAGGGRLAEHMLTTTLFAVIMKSHIIEKESIP